MVRPGETEMTVAMSKSCGQHLTSLASWIERAREPSIDAPFENHFDSSSNCDLSLASKESPIATGWPGIS
jgi:hypothetical protein